MHNPASRFLPLSSFGMHFRESDPRFQQNFRGNGSAASRRLKPRVSFGYRECSCFSVVGLLFDVVALTMQNRSRRLYELTLVERC